CGRRAQFLGNRLRERRSDVLTNFSLTRENGDDAIFTDVQPRGDILRKGFTAEPAAPPPAAGLLCVRSFTQREKNNDAAAQQLEKIAAVGGELIGRAGGKLVAFLLDLVPFRHAAPHSPCVRPSEPR